MFKNYLKVAFRNILKHKFFSAINILGMTVGVTACLLIILYMKDELGYDRFHAKADRIYQVGLHGKLGGQDIRVTSTCPPLAQAMSNEIPEVEEATRIAGYYGDAVIKINDRSFLEERVYFADSNFFCVFSFKVLQGDAKTALKEPNAVVITEKMAVKYFPAGDALGKVIAIGNDNRSYKVTAIADEAPSNSHFHYDILISSTSYDRMKDTMWLSNFLYTYFVLRPNAPLENVPAKFPGMVEKYVGPELEKYMGTTVKQMRESGGAYGYYLTPLTDIRLHSTSQGDIEPGGDIVYVYGFGTIAIFIIVIACINFMNMSTARSAGRAKEVGLRKALGSLRGQMVGQFLAESMIYSFLAVALALLATYLLIPGFNLLAGKELSFSSAMDLQFVSEILAVMLLVGIVAGSYPAFYLTSFSAVEVLKGKIRSGVKSHGVRSALVVLQFGISIFLMIATVIVFNQLDFMQKRNLGLDKHGVVYINNMDKLEKNSESFRNAISQRADVMAVSFTNNTFPGINNTTTFKAKGSELDHIMGLFSADWDQLNVMKFEMVKGRYFSKDFPSDSMAIIINESAAQEFGWTDAVGEEILRTDDDGKFRNLKVIGVLRDFNFETLKNKVRPLAVMLSRSGGSLAVRYEGNPKDLLAGLETQWKQFAADSPFQYAFLDENYDELFRSEQRMSKIFTAFAGLAILIACLGLFALAAFTAEQRTKEIGIRKAMGASVVNLTVLISREFTWLVIIAFALVVVPTWFLADWWLQSFAYRVEIQLWVFALGGVAAIVLAWLTVSYQSLKAANTDPVKSLRYE